MKAFIFYLKNYKAFHHLATMAIMVGGIFLVGFQEILKYFPVQIMLLAANYYITKKTLALSGLDSAVESYLIQIEDTKKDQK